MAARKIVVHVGAHKTGTTSIQRFLHTHRERLRTAGVDFFTGGVLVDNHVELHVSAMRPERISPIKVMAGINGGPDYVLDTSRRVLTFAAASDAPCLVFSAEGLSYVRYDDEFARLKTLLPPGEIEIVYCVREPSEWLASYRWQQREVAGRVNVSDEAWMTNFPLRVSEFRAHFERVTVVDYDAELVRRKSVIPRFLEILGVSGLFQESDWSEFLLNARPQHPVTPVPMLSSTVTPVADVPA